MSNNDNWLALGCAILAIMLALIGIVLPESSSFPSNYPYGNLTGIPQTFPYANLTDIPQSFPYDNLTGIPNTYPYGNLTGVPSVFPYGNLTNVPSTFPFGNLTGVPSTFPYGNLTGIPNVDLMHGLNLWLPFDGVALDKCGYDNDGTVYGASWINGKYGKALSFDGINDYVGVSHNAVLSLPESFTISIWVKYISKTGGAFLIKRGGAETENYALNAHPVGYFILEIWDGTYAPQIVADDKDYADGLFHHVIGVRNIVDDTLKIYVDGVLKKTGTDTTTGSITNTADLEIGTFSPYYTNSIIDEVRIYNRVLNQAEITALYNLP